jgi:1,4-alpha-glucan branching enzyme
MPGDEWQRFANLRLLFGYMFTHPGTNLVFMGAEFGQSSEWNFQQSLDWHLLQYDFHKGIQKLVTDLNTLYRTYPALYEKQFSPEGFQWIDYGDSENSVLTYIRKGKLPKDDLIIACNFTPVPRENYRIGIPKTRKLVEVFNSDAEAYGGSGVINGSAKVSKTPWHGFEHSIEVSLPPLSVVVFR